MRIPFEYDWRITGTKSQQSINWGTYEQPKENPGEPFGQSGFVGRAVGRSLWPNRLTLTEVAINFAHLQNLKNPGSRPPRRWLR
jgi:hypothetical protein